MSDRSFASILLCLFLVQCYKVPKQENSPQNSAPSGVGPTPAMPAPSLSKTGGVYNQPSNVTVNAPIPNAIVCYSINGVTPACDAGLSCIAGSKIPAGWTIQVSSGTLRLLTCAPGYSSSGLVTQTFTLDQIPPANATSFSATAGNTTIQLTWANPSSDFTGIVIMRKTGSAPTAVGDGQQVYSGTGTNLIQTGLTNGVTYYYAAFSTDAAGNYSGGVTASAAPFDPPPGNISISTFNWASSKVWMVWSNPLDSDFAGVRIIKKTGGYPTGPYDGGYVYQGNGTSYTDTAVTNGTTYYYGFYAYDTAGGYSSGVSYGASPSLSSPSLWNLQSGNQQNTFTWYASGTSNTAGIRIVRKAGSLPFNFSDGTVVLNQSTTPGASGNVTDSSLQNGTTYYYAAYAWDSYGVYSAASTGSAKPAIPAPSIFSATAGYNQVSLSWVNPSAGNLASVKVLRKTTGYPSSVSDGVVIYDGTGTSITDTGMPSGVFYYYAAFAVDTGGIASPAAVQTGRPIVIPEVTGLATTNAINQISLSWTNPTTPNFASVKVVRNSWYPSSPTDGTTVYTGTGTTVTETGLPSSTYQYYRVFVYDCCSAVSSGATINAMPAALPEVTGLTTTPGARQIVLNWTNPAIAGVVGVRIMRSSYGFPTNPNSGTPVYTGSATSFTDTPLANDETQFYRVFTYDNYTAYSSGATISSAANPGKEVTSGWNKILTPTGSAAVKVTVDSAGNVYVTGYGYNLVNATSGLDFWIKKFAPDGTEDTANWDKKFNSSGGNSDMPQALSIDAAGNIYVAASINQNGWWLKKFNAAGTEDTVGWNKITGGSLSEPKGIAFDSSGNVFIAGHGEDLVGTNTNRDWWIRKFSPAGMEDMTWNKKIHSSGAFDDGATAIAIGSNDDVYVAGYAYCLVGSSTMDDWWIKKFNSTGTEITSGWDKRFDSGSIYWERPAAIAVDSANYVYVTGYWGESSSGAATQWLTKKFAAFGWEESLGWNKLFPSTSEGYSIAIDASDNVFISGTIQNKVKSSSLNDMVIKKYASDGTEDVLNWDRKFDYSAYYDHAFGLAIGPSGELYIAGLAGATTGSSAWIKKFNP